jgi:hypothetical protein
VAASTPELARGVREHDRSAGAHSRTPRMNETLEALRSTGESIRGPDRWDYGFPLHRLFRDV